MEDGANAVEDRANAVEDGANAVEDRANAMEGPQVVSPCFVPLQVRCFKKGADPGQAVNANVYLCLERCCASRINETYLWVFASDTAVWRERSPTLPPSTMDGRTLEEQEKDIHEVLRKVFRTPPKSAHVSSTNPLV